MASFLDKLAASWGGGYDVDEMARQRAMNDALMNLGTTLMMAGGSGSWQNAAPMLAQAVPSAMGAFRQNLNEEEKRAMLLEERRRREEDYERKRLQEERQDILWERNEKQRVDEVAAAKKLAEQLESEVDSIYETGVNDPDVAAAPDGTKPDLETFWNGARTSLDMFRLTEDPAHLAPLQKAVNDFRGVVNTSEDEAKAREKKALDLGYGGYADMQQMVQADKQGRIEANQALAEQRRAAAEAKEAEMAADARLKEAAANGGFLGIENGFALIENKETGEVEAFPATAAMTAYENTTQRKIDAATKQALALFYDKNGNQDMVVSEALRPYDITKTNDKKSFNNAAAQFANKYGTKIATTPQELQAMAAAISNPENIRAAVEAKIRAPKVAVGESSGQMRAMAELSPQDQNLVDLFLRSSVDEQEKQLFQAALATGKPVPQIVQDFYNIRLGKSGQTP